MADGSEYNILVPGFAGRVPDAAQRVKEALAPLGVVGFIERPNCYDSGTALGVFLAGVRGESLLVADGRGQLSSMPLHEVITDRVLEGFGPEAVFLNNECVYGTPRPEEEHEEPLLVQGRSVCAGTGLRAEHLIVASVKDDSARWRFWEEGETGFARYEGGLPYPDFGFPPGAGTVIELIPVDGEVGVSISAGGRQMQLDFDFGTIPVTTFAPGTPAAELLETVRMTSAGLTPDVIDQLGEMTGNKRAAVDLERSSRESATLEGSSLRPLSDLLRNLGLGYNVLDYAQEGRYPDTARVIEPKGTMERVRVVRAEVKRRTGSQPSFFAALRQLSSGR